MFSFFGQPNLSQFIFEDLFNQTGFGVPRPPYTNQNFREQIPKETTLKKQQSTNKSLDQFTPQQGQYWNILGEQAREQKQYDKAIEYYNKALEITEGSESGIFRNRGETYKLNKQLDLALKDAIQAIELDDKNIKAHLLCGQVMAEMGKHGNNIHSIETAIVRLTKALTLCAGQKKQYYEGQLSKYIYRAKKLGWYKQQEINHNLKKEAIQQYRQLVEQCEDKEQKVQTFMDCIGYSEKPMNMEIPSYLICKITLDIMETPVLTEAGHCYEKDVLIEAVRKNGPIDPTTREPISTKFYPNQNVKQAIEFFLLNNPWAFEYVQGESYMDIEF